MQSAAIANPPPGSYSPGRNRSPKHRPSRSSSLQQFSRERRQISFSKKKSESFLEGNASWIVEGSPVLHTNQGSPKRSNRVISSRSSTLALSRASSRLAQSSRTIQQPQTQEWFEADSIDRQPIKTVPLGFKDKRAKQRAAERKEKLLFLVFIILLVLVLVAFNTVYFTAERRTQESETEDNSSDEIPNVSLFPSRSPTQHSNGDDD